MRLCTTTVNLRTVSRSFLLLLILAVVSTGAVHSQVPDSLVAVSYTRSVSVPMNAFNLYDKALDAWTWTFGKEPGATLRRSDRGTGVIEGTARTNFRSDMLVGREESMGTISYRVVIQVQPGGSRITVSELTHAGNRTAPKGGIHLGPITKGSMPTKKVSGMGRANAEQLYGEVKALSAERITALMQAFEARLRANVGP
jgi:hypothetical protein